MLREKFPVQIGCPKQFENRPGKTLVAGPHDLPLAGRRHLAKRGLQIGLGHPPATPVEEKNDPTEKIGKNVKGPEWKAPNHKGAKPQTEVFEFLAKTRRRFLRQFPPLSYSACGQCSFPKNTRFPATSK